MAGNQRQRQKRAASPPAEMTTVRAAVERDLAELRKRAPELADSGLAASALVLADELDKSNSATSKSMCARALVEVLDKLRERAPAKQEKSKLDDLADRRAKRLTGGAAT